MTPFNHSRSVIPERAKGGRWKLRTVSRSIDASCQNPPAPHRVGMTRATKSKRVKLAKVQHQGQCAEQLVRWCSY
eukprot:scaffold106034_cov30-Tisochrysis_lutea.AAC.4